MTNSGNSSNVIARRAKPKDVLAISTLCRMALDELSTERGGVFLVGSSDSGCMGLDAELTALSSGQLENDNYELNYHWFVGVVNDTPVGAAFIRVVKLHHLSIAQVELLYVEKSSRGHGIGSAILQLLTKWATRKSCVGIDIPALPGKRETKVFLEANGYKARSISMFKEVGIV